MPNFPRVMGNPQGFEPQPTVQLRVVWQLPDARYLQRRALAKQGGGTQVVIGCGVPAAVFYFTEDTFRQVFETQHLH